MTEYGDKLDAGDKSNIESAISALEGVLKSGDKAEIESKIAALNTAAQKLGEKMYADQAGAGAGAAGAAGAQQPGAESGAKQDDDVVDADFKEVKDAK
jgi:molecular chaperone DnaK